MAECGEYPYELIEYLGGADFEGAEILRAEIIDIDRNNNTANVTLLDGCEPSWLIDLTAVDIWYHCEYSTGTLEDLAQGHLAFRDEDEVYLLVLPEVARTEEARAYVVGHVDRRDTQVCAREYLFISRAIYDYLVVGGAVVVIQYFSLYDTIRNRVADLSAFPDHFGKPKSFPAVFDEDAEIWVGSVFSAPTSLPISHGITVHPVLRDDVTEIDETEPTLVEDWPWKYTTSGYYYGSIHYNYAADCNYIEQRITRPIQSGLNDQCLYDYAQVQCEANVNYILDSVVDPALERHYGGIVSYEAHKFRQGFDPQYSNEISVGLSHAVLPTGNVRELNPCSIFGQCTETFTNYSFSRILEYPVCPWYAVHRPQSCGEDYVITSGEWEDASGMMPTDEVDVELNYNNRCIHLDHGCHKVYRGFTHTLISGAWYWVADPWEHTGTGPYYGGGDNNRLVQGTHHWVMYQSNYCTREDTRMGGGPSASERGQVFARPNVFYVTTADIARAAANEYDPTPSDILDNPMSFDDIVSFHNKQRGLRVEAWIRNLTTHVWTEAKTMSAEDMDLAETAKRLRAGPSPVIYNSSY